MDNAITLLQRGEHHDPFQFLGCHSLEKKHRAIRAFMPAAVCVELEGVGEMHRVDGTDCFELTVSSEVELPTHYRLNWREKESDSRHATISPYSFTPQVGDLDLHLFQAGDHHHAWHFLGARLITIDGVGGCQFAVWAPAVTRVSVVGDFNGWDGCRHPMRCRGESGIWELFVPGLIAGDVYKYEIVTRHGDRITKCDPYGREMAMRPDTTSRVPSSDLYSWLDQAWMERRAKFDWQHQPISIYELHAGSWQRHHDGKFLNWRQLAERLIPYLLQMGYTHLELLPVTEHPFDQSWGYQVSGYFAPTARHGSPDDFRYFVDQCHQNSLGVILDWVPAHFPRDDFALARFTGEPLYEHADPRRGEHQHWGTLIFDYGRNEVKNFLITNAIYWLEEFHIDGLRVDAVASMLYLDYARNEGEWQPNQYGGRENLEAIEFLRETNRLLHGYFPGVLTIAEESTAWPMVSRPVEVGGLGFSMKWNMGWMNDSLSYIEQDPVHRKYAHNQLTFSQMYAWSENFVLPLSHDEVVHMKGSMLSKMPGDDWQKMANLRVFYAWHYSHPGKKLLFMGSELGQWEEWDEMKCLDWALTGADAHSGLQKLVCDLNHLYRKEPALYQFDFIPEGFQWIDCHDSDQSVLVFMRKSSNSKESVVCVLNFTPVPRIGYRIGVPAAAKYAEILNSDSHYYGGSDMGNSGGVDVDPIPWMGFEQSITIVLPPLAAIFLKGEQ